MDGQHTDKPQGIQVITRAADILRVLGQSAEGQSLGQIAAQVGLPRSTVQRIVAALSLEGFVSSDKAQGGLRLGPAIHALAERSGRDMTDRLRPVMTRIADQTGETVDLAVLRDGKMLFVDQIVGRHRLRTVSSIGEAFAVSTTANGKAALACLDPAEARALILAEKAGAAPPRRSVEAILRELDTIRGGALARDENEHTDGVSALGFALRSPQHEIYAISTPVPSSRYRQVAPSLARVLLACKAELNA